MLLSIVVPIYNVEEYLHRCVQSLLKTNEDLEYEIILIDDGSKDKSGEISDEYSLKYDYVKSFHKPNGGLSDARNYGLQKATGKYVIFIDSDDYVESGSIEAICDHIKDAKADIYCCDYYSLCANQRKDITYTHVDKALSGEDFLRFQFEHCSMISSVVQNIYSRELLIENNLYFKKGIYHEDEEWYPRVFLSAKTVKYLNLVYYVYVIRENSIMQQRDLSKHIKDFISTMKSLMQAYEKRLDPALFALLKDSLVDKYLSIYARGNFGAGYSDIVLPKKMLRGGLVHCKTKIKVMVFNLSRKLFCKFSRIYNKSR